MDHISNVYVINMDESKDRLKMMTDQIPKIGKPFIRIPAINGKKMSYNDLKQSSTPFCQMFCTHSIIGCFLSHKKTWKTIVDNNDDYALVMEDDCAVGDTFVTDLKNVMDELLPFNPDFVYLGCFGNCDYDNQRKNVVDSLISSFSFPLECASKNYVGTYAYVPKNPIGFHCYVISNKCAKYLLQQMPKAHYHVDINFLLYTQPLNVFASKKKLGNQFTSSKLSTQSVDFPVTINYFLDNIKDSNGMSYSYYFSAPLIQILWHRVNLYFILASLFMFIYPHSTLFNFFMILFLLEFVVNPRNIVLIATWCLSLYIIYRFRN